MGDRQYWYKWIAPLDSDFWPLNEMWTKSVSVFRFQSHQAIQNNQLEWKRLRKCNRHCKEKLVGGLNSLNSPYKTVLKLPKSMPDSVNFVLAFVHPCRSLKHKISCLAALRYWHLKESFETKCSLKSCYWVEVLCGWTRLTHRAPWLLTCLWGEWRCLCILMDCVITDYLVSLTV